MLGIMYKQIKLIELFLVQSNAFRGLWLAVPLKIAIIFSFFSIIYYSVGKLETCRKSQVAEIAQDFKDRISSFEQIIAIHIDHCPLLFFCARCMASYVGEDL